MYLFRSITLVNKKLLWYPCATILRPSGVFFFIFLSCSSCGDFELPPPKEIAAPQKVKAIQKSTNTRSAGIQKQQVHVARCLHKQQSVNGDNQQVNTKNRNAANLALKRHEAADKQKQPAQAVRCLHKKRSVSNDFDGANQQINIEDINTTNVDLKQYDAAHYDRHFRQIESYWNSYQKKQEERTIIETEHLIVSYNLRWGVMSIGTPQLLMLDLDYKDVDNKERALSILGKYVKENPDTVFSIRATERGMHAFIISQKMDPTAEKTKNMMFQLYSDVRYIAYCVIRGFCVRISPKPFYDKYLGPGKQVRSPEDMQKQFISKKPSHHIIGNPRLIQPELSKLLTLHDELVAFIYKMFTEHYDDITKGVSTSNVKGVIDRGILLEKIKPRIEAIIQQAGYPLEGGKYPLDKGEYL